MNRIIITFLVLIGTVTGMAQQNEIAMTKTVDSKSYAIKGATQSIANFEGIISSAFQTGNAGKIATYFAGNINLSIHDKSSLYSKSQAHQILKNFFIADKPVNFTIMHQGNIDKHNFYLIGELKTAGKKTYRVTVNSRQGKGGKQITSLIIESASYLQQ